FLEPAEPNGHHPFPERHSTHGRNAHEVHGIDIAKYQGTIDWQAVKRSGVDFVFIKATEGTDVLDDRFAANWAAAKAAGIPRGAYHFNYWCTSLEDQFHWFRRNVPRDRDALPPVLDLEWNHASPTCPKKVSRARAKAEIRKFVRLAEAWYGKRPILYTDIPFYRDVLSDGAFRQYPLWVRSVKRLPQDIYKGRKWALWQYSDRSRVPGIRGRVDKNAFAGSRRDWNKLLASRFQHRNVVMPDPATQKPVAVAGATPSTTQSAAPQATGAEAKVVVAQGSKIAARTAGEAKREASPAQAAAYAATHERRSASANSKTSITDARTVKRPKGAAQIAGKPLNLMPASPANAKRASNVASR
ncbi:MAG: hypothetical protein KDJ29_02725, partial [Hyphomicrobiales bacterium]|nr:hypothetical protein [Hyphomicrobiales bacterium]